VLASRQILVSEAVVAVGNTVPSGVDKELILTLDEKIAFDKFKATIFGNLTHDFMRQDLYILRWIRAKELNVERATKDTFQFLEFFKTNNIENILKEDWKDCEEDYPFHSDITDRAGRPVAYGSVGSDWNVRRGMLQGKGARIMRYTYKLVFELNSKLIEIQKKQQNITQFTVVINLEGFNVIQHACPMCVTTYINLLENYDRFLPGFAHEILVINAPDAYLYVVDILRQSLTKPTGDALRVYGGNKKTWKAHIDSLIDPSKLPQDFGGTAEDKH